MLRLTLGLNLGSGGTASEPFDGITATGVQSLSEVGGPTVFIVDLTATGVESASEAGSATISATAPDFTALTVGPQSGSDLPITATVTGGLDPNYISGVGIASGGTAIDDPAKIRAGTDQSDASAPFWISEQAVSGNVTDQVLATARENAFDGNMDFYFVFATQSSGGLTSQIQSDTGIAITITVDSGTLELDAGSASTTTNEAFDGGSASSTTNEVLDFAA